MGNRHWNSETEGGVPLASLHQDGNHSSKFEFQAI